MMETTTASVRNDWGHPKYITHEIGTQHIMSALFR